MPPISLSSPDAPKGDWLAWRAAASPDAVALVTEGQTLTFAELYGLADAVARRLAGWGVRQESRVGVFVPSSLDGVVLTFALMRLGAVGVWLNRRLTGEEINFQLQNAEADFLIHDDEMSDDVKTSAAKLRLSEVNKLVPANDLLQFLPKDDAPILIMHTSGTSGTPKGVELAYGNIFYSAMASKVRLGSFSDDRWLCVLPLYHIGGLSILLRSVLYGTAIDLMPKFDAEIIDKKLRDEPISMISLVPTMLFRLLQHKTATWNDKFRLALIGGAAATPELVAAAKEAGVPIATTYGLTEASSQVATALPEVAMQKIGTVGQPLDGTQIQIVGDDGGLLPPNTYGEIVVKAPSVMRCYLGYPPTDGFLKTGDIGYLDDDGDLWLLQRRSDLIVTGGENVYPAEVEAALRMHPAIQDVCVVGVPHAEWGQQVAAALVLKHPKPLEHETLLVFLRDHLAGYKLPRQIKVMDALPQTSSGKVQRGAVCDAFSGD